MPKLFCVSDIHGFYDEFKAALDAAGFDQGDLNHWLIVCGDCFDRGKQPRDVYRFLQGLQRKVLIRGNHEDLLEKLIERGYPLEHDKHNQTHNTVYDLANVPHEPRKFSDAAEQIDRMVFKFNGQMVNYFETKNYIFVHGWIPLKITDRHPKWFRLTWEYAVDPEWRNADHADWEVARWQNGIECALKGLLPDKTVVCGHWHCSYGHTMVDDTPEFGSGADFSPFYHEGIIAIDGCTASSGHVNVVVLDDEFLT